MPLIDFIQKLQEKPRYLRIQILWISVLVCMLIVVSLWVTSFKYSSPSVAEEKKTDELSKSFEEIKQEIPSLKQAFKASIGAFFEDDLEQESPEADLGTLPLNVEATPLQREIIPPTKLPLSK